MKKVLVFVNIMFICILFNNVSFAQFNKVLNKAKENVKEVSKSNDAVDSNNPSQKTLSNNSENNIKEDPQFKEWFDAKYDIISQSDYSLMIYDIQNGNFDGIKQLEGAKLLDYPNTLKKINDNIETAKASVMESSLNNFLEYGKKYADVFNSIIKKEINKTIDESYKNLKTNESYGIKLMINAKSMLDAALLIIPENNDVQAFSKEVEKLINNVLNPYYARIYTSDWHKSNAGKILFSNKPIVIGKEDPAQFKTSFLPNENIYAVVYLSRRIKDLANVDASMCVYHVKIDEDQNSKIQFKHNEGDELLSYYLIEIIPDPKVAIHGLDPKEFGQILSNLSPRTHQFYLGFGEEYSEFAQGSIKLEYENYDGTKIKANNDLAAQNAQNNWAKNMRLPEEFNKTSQTFNDANMSVEKIKTMILSSNQLKGKISQILKVQIGEADNDWILYHNELGVPTHKSNKKSISIVYKGTDGWCYFSDRIHFICDYSGGGNYAKPRLSNYDIRLSKIACENLNKK